MHGTETTLTLERFRHLAEAYGARLELWPEAERAAARALSLTEPEAAEILRREAALDALVATLPPPAPASAAVLARVLAQAPRGRQGLLQRLEDWLQLPGPAWLAPAALSLAVLAGGLAGGVTGGPAGLVPGATAAVAVEDTLESILALGPSEEDLGS